MIDCVDVMSQQNVESLVKALVLNLFWLADPLGLYFEHKVPYIKSNANYCETSACKKTVFFVVFKRTAKTA